MDSARYKELEICNLRHAAWEIPILTCKGGQMLTVIMTLPFHSQLREFSDIEQQILHLASVSIGFRLLLLPPSTSYRDSSQIFGACRDCTNPSKCKEARTFIITQSQLPLLQLYNCFLLFSAKVRKDSLATHEHPHVPRLYPYGCSNLKLTSYSCTQLYCLGKDLHCHGRKSIMWDIINCPLSTLCCTGISINHLKFLNSRLRYFCRNGEHLWFSEDAFAAQVCIIFAPACALSRGQPLPFLPPAITQFSASL